MFHDILSLEVSMNDFVLMKFLNKMIFTEIPLMICLKIYTASR